MHAGEVGSASAVKEVRVSSFAQHLLSCIQQDPKKTVKMCFSRKHNDSPSAICYTDGKLCNTAECDFN